MHHRIVDTRIEDAHISLSIADSSSEASASECVRLRVRLDALDIPGAFKVNDMQLVDLNACDLGDVRAAALRRVANMIEKIADSLASA